MTFFIQLSRSFNYRVSQESPTSHGYFSLNKWKEKKEAEKTWDPFFSFYRPGVLQSMGLQRVRHDWATEHQQEYFMTKANE